MTGQLVMFTVYFNPLDYPGKYVARRFVITAGEATPDPDVYCVADTLEECRDGIHPQLDGLFARIERSPHDDGVIVESWV